MSVKLKKGIRRRLVNNLAVRYDLPVSLVRRMVHDLFAELADELAETGHVEVRGFGAWDIVPARTHNLRHPGTGLPCKPRSDRDIRFFSGRDLARRCGALRHRHRRMGVICPPEGRGV